jgi:hypothetical protein
LLRQRHCTPGAAALGVGRGVAAAAIVVEVALVGLRAVSLQEGCDHLRVREVHLPIGFLLDGIEPAQPADEYARLFDTDVLVQLNSHCVYPVMLAGGFCHRGARIDDQVMRVDVGTALSQGRGGRRRWRRDNAIALPVSAANGTKLVSHASIIQNLELCDAAVLARLSGREHFLSQVACAGPGQEGGHSLNPAAGEDTGERLLRTSQ